MRGRMVNEKERGTAVVEFAIAATVLFILIFGIVEYGRLLWTHNALADATRRGARYAVLYGPNVAKVKNVVVYGDPAIYSGTPVVGNLTPNNVSVEYACCGPYGTNSGAVTVKIVNYQFNFVVPLFGGLITMPDYRTTMPAEWASDASPNG
jgi:Flp pilus assembly protein TadG